MSGRKLPKYSSVRWWYQGHKAFHWGTSIADQYPVHPHLRKSVMRDETPPEVPPPLLYPVTDTVSGILQKLHSRLAGYQTKGAIVVLDPHLLAVAIVTPIMSRVHAHRWSSSIVSRFTFNDSLSHTG